MSSGLDARLDAAPRFTDGCSWRPSNDDIDSAIKYLRGERSSFDALPPKPHPFIAHLDEQAAAIAAITEGKA